MTRHEQNVVVQILRVLGQEFKQDILGAESMSERAMPWISRILKLCPDQGGVELHYGCTYKIVCVIDQLPSASRIMTIAIETQMIDAVEV